VVHTILCTARLVLSQPDALAVLIIIKYFIFFYYTSAIVKLCRYYMYEISVMFKRAILNVTVGDI